MFFVALAEISLIGKVNRVVIRLITRGVVVLRLLDSGEWSGEVFGSLCTHHPSLLPIEWSGEVFGLWQQRQFAIPDVA